MLPCSIGWPTNWTTPRRLLPLLLQRLLDLLSLGGRHLGDPDRVEGGQEKHLLRDQRDAAGEVAARVDRLLAEGQRLGVRLVEPHQVALAIGARRQVNGVRLQREGRGRLALAVGGLLRRPEGDLPARRAVLVGCAPGGDELDRRYARLLRGRGVDTLAVAAALSLLPPLVATTITTTTSARAATIPTRNCVRRLPPEPPSPLKNAATREAKPGPFGAVWAGGAARRRGSLLRGCERAWGGRRSAATTRLGDLGEIGPRGEQSQVLDESLRERVRLWIALQVAYGVRPADGVGLAEEVVAQPDLGVRIRAADLLQGGTRP